MKVQKNLSLELGLAQRLKEEENATALVEDLLRDHYEIESDN